MVGALKLLAYIHTAVIIPTVMGRCAYETKLGINIKLTGYSNYSSNAKHVESHKVVNPLPLFFGFVHSCQLLCKTM